MEQSAVSGRAAPVLTIDPARGGVFAAGGIMLAVGITMTDTRLDVAWSNGVHLIVALFGFALVFGIAMLSPLPGRPLAYQAVLSLSGLALLVLVLDRLVPERLGGRPECRYVHLLREATEAAAAKQCDLAVLVPPATMSHVEQIAGNLEKMPPKSTYFYPKLLSGLVFNSLKVQ